MLNRENKSKVSLDQANAIVYPPNSIQLPHSICDFWMSNLSPAEFKILVCIYRKCYASQNLKNSISLKQIQDMTGLSNRGIQKSLKPLLQYGLIQKDQPEIGNEIAKYKLCFMTSDKEMSANK